jgi:hypothetical protein
MASQQLVTMVSVRIANDAFLIFDTTLDALE